MKFGGFVGRERELDELRHALDETRERRGRLFLISGEPGIGKTRLAEKIAREAAARGTRAVWGRCWEGGGAPAYWPWIQVIRGCVSSADPAQRRAALESELGHLTLETVAQIVPELHTFSPHPLKPVPTSVNAEQARFQLLDSVTTLLTDFARLGPLAILLDDLHDADDSSLIMLQFVARQAAGTAILIVGTYRVDEVRQSPELSKQIGDLSRGARSIPLVGLSQAEVAEFIGLSSGQAPDQSLVARLHAATGGNPLFVDGIVRMLVADPEAGPEIASDQPFKIPHTLREAIRSRLAVLSNEARSLLNVAAAIGNEFEADVCVQAAAVSREEFNSLVDEASRGGLVKLLGQSRYRFAHALIRAGLYDALDTNTRIRLHGRIAETIEAIYAKDKRAHVAELAHHFRAAGVIEKAITYSRRASQAAFEVFSYADSAAHSLIALTLSEDHNDLRRADILLGLGRVTAFHLDPAEGIARLEEALSLYRELENEERVAATNVFLGQALASQADFSLGMNVPRALEYFRQALARKGEWTDLGVLGTLYNSMAQSLYQANRIDEAIGAAQQAKQIWMRASDPAWIAAASLCARLLMIKGRHSEAAVLLDEAAVVAQEMTDPELFRSAMFERGWCRMAMRDPIEAKRFFSRGMDKKGVSPLQAERNFEFLANVEFMTGDLVRAKAIAAEHRVQPGFRSSIAYRGGDWEAAIEMNLPMLEWTRRTGHRWDEVHTLWLLVQMLRTTGDFQRATNFLGQTLRAYHPSDVFWEMYVRPLASQLAIAMGRPDEANQHLEVCRAIIAQGEDWLGLAGSVARAEGMLAAVQGRNFAIQFENAIANHQRYSLPFDEADTLYYWGVALNAAGEYSLVNEKLDAAIEMYRRYGAGQRWIDRAEAARHSVSPAPKTREPAAASPRPSIFRKEGEYWTLSYQETTFRLRHIKGLAYMMILLAHPGQRFHVKELLTMVEGAGTGNRTNGDSDLALTNDLGGRDAAFDPQARADYRNRLKELQAELDEADRFNDFGRAAHAREELDFLKSELSSSIGIGGHARLSSTHSERVRLMVGKNIRVAIDKIRQRCPTLGRHFATSISSGNFCSYQPDPEDTISWQLEAE